MRLIRAAVLAGLSLSVVAVAGGAAQAQRSTQLKPLTAPKPQVQPAALPGSALLPGAADRMQAPTSMAPNEALFDAVNRGDMAGAREAINRGADVESRNVLGLTPIELSVDLGRSDITFLLLPLRGTGGRKPVITPPAPPPSGQMARVATAPRVAVSQEGDPPPSASRPVAAAPVARVQPVTAPVRVAATPRSNDPGTPAPQAGFLGFGSRP